MGITNNKNRNQNGDLLWSQTVWGTDGDSDKVVAAEIRCYADNSVSSGVVPGRWELWTANSTGVLTKALTLSSTQTATLVGAQTFTGGVAQAVAPSGFHNVQPATATSGTDTTPANGTQFVTTIWIPANITLTGVGYLIGSVGGTDKVYAALYDASGALCANSSVAGGGATVGTAAQTQTLAFTSTYAAKGPAMYYVGISMNGNTARLRTLAAYTNGGHWAGSVAQAHGTVAAITAPTTFTADKGPFVWVY